MTAESIEHVASYWVIFQSFHSPTLGGFAVISHWVPYLVFSVYTGALADRFDCRRLIQAAQGLLMLASLAWGALFLTGTLRAWHGVALQPRAGAPHPGRGPLGAADHPDDRAGRRDVVLRRHGVPGADAGVRAPPRLR